MSAVGGRTGGGWRPVIGGFLLVAGPIVLGAPASVGAQDPGSGAGGDAEPIAFPTAVPESPAVVFLGSSPTDVLRPGTARDLGVSLLSGIGRDGGLQQGFALEVTPSFVVPGLMVSLDDYQSSRLKFVLANTQLSMATARVAGDSASTDLSVGIRMTLWNEADPMRDTTFTRRIAGSLRACLPATPDPDEAEIRECSDSVMSLAREDYERRDGNGWNAGRVVFGAASGLRFEESSLSERNGLGVQLWLVGGLPIGTRAQLIGQVSYADRASVADEEATTLLSYGARLVVGSPSFNGFAEIVDERRRSESGVLDDDRGSWSAGVEWRLADKLWLSTGLGARFASLEADRVGVIANLRWGVGDAARLNALRPGAGG